MFNVFRRGKTETDQIEIHDGAVANKAYYKIGTLLKLSSGVLTVCGATDNPEFLCVSDHSAETASTFPVAVVRIDPGSTYETTLSVASANIAEGVKYTLANGTQITATADNGVAEVVEFDGKAAGDRVVVRFASVVIQNITQAAAGTE